MKISRKSTAIIASTALMCSSSAYAEDNSTSFYGLIDVFAGSVKATGSDDSKLVVDSSGLTTSFIGVKTKLDLGDGLAGLIVLETFLRPDTGDSGRFDGDQFYARDAFVGLQGKFGEVTVGRNTTPHYLSVIQTNTFGGAFGFGPSIKHSFLGGLENDSGWGNSILYAPPESNGFKSSFLYSAGEYAGESSKASYGANAFYTTDKLTATVSVQSVTLYDPTDVLTIDDKQTASLFGAKYNTGPAIISFQYMKMTTTLNAGDTDYKTFHVGITVPVNKANVMLSYAKTNKDIGTTDSDRSTIALGYDKTMSEKVDLYAVLYSDDPYDNASSGRALVGGGRFKF